MYVHGDHWITISNLKCNASEIIVYNSHVDQEVKDLINLLDREVEVLTSRKCRSKKEVLIVAYMPLLLPQHSCMGGLHDAQLHWILVVLQRMTHLLVVDW